MAQNSPVDILIFGSGETLIPAKALVDDSMEPNIITQKALSKIGILPSQNCRSTEWPLSDSRGSIYMVRDTIELTVSNSYLAGRTYKETFYVAHRETESAGASQDVVLGRQSGIRDLLKSTGLRAAPIQAAVQSPEEKEQQAARRREYQADLERQRDEQRMREREQRQQEAKQREKDRNQSASTG